MGSPTNLRIKTRHLHIEFKVDVVLWDEGSELSRSSKEKVNFSRQSLFLVRLFHVQSMDVHTPSRFLQQRVFQRSRPIMWKTGGNDKLVELKQAVRNEEALQKTEQEKHQKHQALFHYRKEVRVEYLDLFDLDYDSYFLW